MYTLELTLKGNPALLSVQRKDEDDALQLYRKVLDALKSGSTGVLELRCDRTEKQLAVLLQEVTSVQLRPKTASTAAATANRPGFFAQLDGEKS